jgi:leucyl-tRNA synthetase
MDTFVDSSWYFLRYCSPDHQDGPFDPAAVREWMPVAQYVGGVEHAILHLLYSRFFVKVLHDMGMVDAVEPFAALMNQGQVINQGKAMSKSLGNGVDLGTELSAFGVDAVRLTVVFAGPPEDDIDWADVSPAGSVKYLARVARLAEDVAALSGTDRDLAVDKAVARAVDEVTRATEAQRLNVAVAKLMELTNALRKGVDAPSPAGGSLRDGVEALAVMLGCWAPYTAEEAWSRLGHDVEAGDSVHDTTWPTADPALLVQESVTCVVQVQGKVRERLEVAPDIGEDELRSLAWRPRAWSRRSPAARCARSSSARRSSSTSFLPEGLALRDPGGEALAMPPPPGPASSVEEAPSSTAKVSTKYYEKELARLQVELVKQQEHIRAHGLKVVVIFEGRTPPARAGASSGSPRASTRARRGSWRSPRRPSARRRSGTSSATSPTCRRPARWSCSTAPGTTAPASSG